MDKKTNNSIKILVTGGAGFIGTHLIRELVKCYEGPSLDVVDNLSNSILDQYKKDFFQRYNVNFYKSSVEDFVVPEGRQYDYIYHLASPVGPAGVLKYAGRMGAMILNDSIKMAELALAHDVKLMEVSTSEVYGQHPPDDKGQNEDVPKVVPPKITVRLEYGVGKLMTEIALLNLAKVKPLKVNFIRPFNIIGSYQKGEAGFVVPRFVESAFKNEPLTVFGDGNQKRTFTHVLDIVEAMIAVMESGHKSQIYNIGNPENLCSIKNLADKIIDLTGSKSKINFVDPKTIYGPLYEEAWNKIPDISRISKDVSWRPKYSLDQALSEYIEFAKNKTL